MSITIETDGATVFLPEVAPVLVPPENARASIKRDRAIRKSHLFPLFDACASFACSLLMVQQGCETFNLPQGPWIIAIGDDFHFAWGPAAFGDASLDAAIKAAAYCVLISSGPEPYPYRVAATVAARDRRNVLLIETQPYQQEAWQERVRRAHGEGIGMFYPEAAE